MDSNTPAVIASAMTTATLTQGFMLFVTQNATFITTASIAVTSFVGVVSFVWGKFNDGKRIKIEDRRVDAMEESNRINEQLVGDKLISKLAMSGLEMYTIQDVKEYLRN